MSAVAVVAAAPVLAASGEASKAGPIGLAVILLLCIACYFLFKSMSKHMRRVREDFPPDPPGETPDGAPAAPPRGSPARPATRAEIVRPEPRTDGRASGT